MINIDAEIYNEFRCKADKCKHSCCKGWEIDIDEDTLEYYKDLDTELGNEILQNIQEEEDTHFKLTDDDRCPFLKDNGLCKLIEELGEDSLCDICRLHPRFFEDINDYSLAGVGLSCEKVTELIFEKKSLDFIICDSQKKLDIYELLKLLDINILHDSLDLSKMIPDYLEEGKIEKVLDIFSNTVPIDDKWKNEVLLIKSDYKKLLEGFDSKDIDIKKYEITYQYILFRQLELIEQYGTEKIIDYAIYSIIFIILYARLFHDDIEAVRRWSEQIEYNEDNINTLINELELI
ncbi:MAG: flagellin lysine-N-methylase [Eubacterium sp.]|nr:flagellin lysine-N-methylase [Eubacterium sp.]